MAQHKLTKADGTNVLWAAYQYYDDGQLKFVDDLRDNRFDRLFTYDQSGRLTQAVAGNYARGATAKTYDSAVDGPYNHTYTYDAFENLTKRGGFYWYAEVENYTAKYVNNRNQNAGWEHDADGRVTKSLTGNSGGDTFDRTFTYDAEGRGVEFTYHTDGQLIRGALDGDGQPTTQDANRVVRSSVLGGSIVSKINKDGGKISTNVYVGGEIVAQQYFHPAYGQFPASEELRWMGKRDPAQTNLIDMHGTRSALDVQGIGTSAPDYESLNATPDLYNDMYGKYNYSAGFGGDRFGGFPGDFGGGCTVDGIVAPCSMAMGMLNSGAAAQCPNNDCSPRYIDGSFRFVTATADGYVGYAPIGAVYLGNGYWANGRGSTPPTLRRGDVQNRNTPVDILNREADGRLDRIQAPLFNWRDFAFSLAPQSLDDIYKTPPCNVAGYDQLSQNQRGLIGSDAYNKLSQLQRAVFANITGALSNAGANFAGLKLSSVEDDRLYFSPQSTNDFRNSIVAGTKANPATFNKVGFVARQFGGHDGMDSYMVRQNVAANSLQVGFGKKGAFADIDLWNPQKEFGKHQDEIKYNGKHNAITPHFYLARELGNCK